MTGISMNIKKLNEKAILPTRGSEYAAGYDLYANIVRDSEAAPTDITIPAGKTEMIGTGLAMEIPKGYAGLVFARSGLASKRGLRPANCVGVVDSDYRGEVKVALHNDSNNDETIFADDRIAQLVIVPYLSVDFNMVDELNDTERGSGGVGSTGVSTEPIYEQASFF